MSTPSPDSEAPLEPDVEATEAPSAEALSRFPVLIGVLEEYFVGRDRTSSLLKKYHRVGEESAEFEGLSEELRDAVRNPRVATPVVNQVLGSSVSHVEMRTMLSDLRDQLLQTGEFSPEALDDARNEAVRTEKSSKPTPNEMLDYYARRKFAVPFVPWFKDHPFPLYYYLVVGVAVLLVGIGLGQIPWPSWMEWLPTMFSAVGIILTGFSVISMASLRGEIANPESEATREGREEFHSKREAKREAKRQSKEKGDSRSLAERARGIFG